MTIEIQMTKEITEYESKFIGPFTLRQTACGVVAAVCCIPIYKYLNPVIPGAWILCIIPAGLALAMSGYYKPYGMKPEKFIQSIFINMVLAPQNRKYKIENVFDQTESDEEENPQTAEESSEQPENTRKSKENNQKNSKKRKKKYKLSSEAVK